MIYQTIRAAALMHKLSILIIRLLTLWELNPVYTPQKLTMEYSLRRENNYNLQWKISNFK
jgi:hypothetical protein